MSHFAEVLCWLGALQCFILGSHLITKKSGSKAQKNLLSALFLALSVRVLKSTLFIFYNETSAWIINAGFAAQCLIAPALYHYIRSFRSSYHFDRSAFVHFTPALAIVLLSPFLTLDNFWYKGGYSLLLYYNVLYVGFSLYELYATWNSREEYRKDPFPVITVLALSVFQLLFVTNYEMSLTPYLAGPILNTVSVYIISFMILNNRGTYSGVSKYRNLKLNEQQLEKYACSVRTVLDDHSKPFLDQDFSLTKLSGMVNIPEHVLSCVFSNRFKKNFNHVITLYRIEEAKKLLQDRSMDHFTIAAIAADCGFNSLSSFNTAFKKITNETPSQFKRRTSFL